MPSTDLFKSSHLKIDRASEHIQEAIKILTEERPFRYLLKTDVKSGLRSIGPDRNEAVVDEASLIIGDAIHNLRSAIDHAYTADVTPELLATDNKKSIQFPFSATEANLEKACQSRHAHKVGPEFLSAIMGLKPYDGPGGNRLLAFLHYSDIPDKHAHLIPTGYVLDISAEFLRNLVPDFPECFHGNISIGNAIGYDVQWDGPKYNLHEWVSNKTPANGVFEQEIDIPVELTFYRHVDGHSNLVIPTLDQFVDVTKNAVSVISQFA